MFVWKKDDDVLKRSNVTVQWTNGKSSFLLTEVVFRALLSDSLCFKVLRDVSYIKGVIRIWFQGIFRGLWNGSMSNRYRPVWRKRFENSYHFENHVWAHRNFNILLLNVLLLYTINIFIQFIDKSISFVISNYAVFVAKDLFWMKKKKKEKKRENNFVILDDNI